VGGTSALASGGSAGRTGRGGSVSIDGSAGDAAVAGRGGLGAAGAPLMPVGSGGTDGIGGTGGRGAVGGRAGTGAVDEEPGGQGGSDVAEPPPECDPCPCDDGPFGEPELVLGLGVADESFGPAPSADGLTLLFSAVGADEDIFFATRGDRANGFFEASAVAGVDQPDTDEGTPFESFDGRSLYFFSTREGPGVQGGRDLWVAQSPGGAAGFVSPSVVPNVNFDGLDHLPRLSRDGLSLMFVSGRTSPNLGSNIWVSDRQTPTSPFGEPVELAGVNTNAREEGFWLTSDGLTIYFASNRASDEADMDIWVATRPDTSSPFGVAENLSVVNSSGIEIDPALTADGFELFFASNRSGTMQIYRSARSCP
jgi:Tol biopolymer transport system component